MLLPFDCTICGRSFEVGDDRAGSSVRCPHCGTANQIPWTHGTPPPAPLPPPLPPPRVSENSPPAKEGVALPFAVSDGAEPPTRGNKKRRYRILLLSLTALVTFLCLPCGLTGWWYFRSTSLGSEQKYFPDRTQLVLSIQVDKALNSDLIKNVRTDRKDEPFDDKTTENRFGIPLSQIERITVAGSTADAKEMVWIFRTRKSIKAGDIKSNLGRSNYDDTNMNGFIIYQANDESQYSFCVVEDKVVLFAPMSTLQAILKRGKKPVLPETMMTALAKADFSRTVAFAINFKELRKESDKDLNNHPIPVTQLVRNLGTWLGKEDLEKQFRNLESLSGSITVKSEVTGEIIAICSDSSSCDELKSCLASGLLKVKTRDKVDEDTREAALDNAFRELSQTAMFSQNGNTLTITFSLPRDPMTRVIKTVDGGPDDIRMTRAREDVKAIAKCVMIFAVNNGDFPPDIETMTKPANGGPPLLPAEKMMDPWNHPYQLKIEDGDAVVFTTTPSGKMINSKEKK
jgi:hypothetical protein